MTKEFQEVFQQAIKKQGFSSPEEFAKACNKYDYENELGGKGILEFTEEDKKSYGIKPMPKGIDYMDGNTHPEEMGNFMRCLGDKFLAAAAILDAKKKAGIPF